MFFCWKDFVFSFRYFFEVWKVGVVIVFVFDVVICVFVSIGLGVCYGGKRRGFTRGFCGSGGVWVGF